MSERGNGYHHGELPDTLINLALHHVHQHGTEKLSLRALAREAGVSPTAPYRHFSSKQCLLAAIAAQGFQELRQRHLTIKANSRNFEDCVIEMSVAYVEFALENPTSYQIMFGSVLGDFSDYQMLEQAVDAAYAEVDAVLVEIIAARSLPVDVALLGGVMWSYLHGMSSLLIRDVHKGRTESKPMCAIAALRADPETALQLIFGPLLSCPRAVPRKIQ